ncbi:MAG: DUF177 domain-containing protein [Deltaproteobacteria bacterium]|nr:DUF177 domain-containing protein [Deltaproteobacteria bacterium]
MIVDLSTVDSGPRHFDFTLNQGWWQGEKGTGNSQIQELDGSLACRIEIARVGVRYLLDGSISGYALATCDRCLESYRRLLDSEFRLFLSAHVSDPDQSEIDLSEEDMAVQFVEGDEVDLFEIVREQIYISLPMKSLCRKDCSGLCPVCGIDLNKNSCKCHRGEGHPGLSKLKDLILNGEH